ncbi:hypothetical protein P5673_006969, partial [Acropora cervicornis]
MSLLLDWTKGNGITRNTPKCKEFTIRKRGNRDLYIYLLRGYLAILGFTFQSDSKFSMHVNNKLILIANKSPNILGTLRKEGYNQLEKDPLFNTNTSYALSVYAASDYDLTSVQCFLDRFFKRKYTYKSRQDHKISGKVIKSTVHPLLPIITQVKPSSPQLRKGTFYKPKINIIHFKNSFIIHRLVSKYELPSVETDQGIVIVVGTEVPKKEKEIKKKEVMTREDLALLFFPFSKKKSVRV